MCLILFAKNYHPGYKFIFAANRDEFFDRPAKFMAETQTGIYSGIDLKEGGRWFGIADDGKIAAITNFRDFSSIKEDARSRGLILNAFFDSGYKIQDYLEILVKEREIYNGYNLLIGSVAYDLYYYSNRKKNFEKVSDGLHGLSNAYLDTDWPKVVKGKVGLDKIISEKFCREDLFQLLSDKTEAPDELLPDTGVGNELEKKLSPIFISSDKYGTRCSTVLTVDNKNNVELEERSFNNKGETINISGFKFRI